MVRNFEVMSDLLNVYSLGLLKYLNTFFREGNNNNNNNDNNCLIYLQLETKSSDS
jgi:hypothetical protein